MTASDYMEREFREARRAALWDCYAPIGAAALAFVLGVIFGAVVVAEALA